MAYQSLDSDEAGNGRSAANASPMTTRAIEISPNKDIKLFYTFDGVYGGEIARTAVPTVTERVADLTGATGISEFIDVTSGGHAVGFDVLNVGPAGRLSVAYTSNLDATVQSSSDRLSSGTLQTAETNAASGYSVGYSVTPGPVKVALGYTKIDQMQSTSAQDATSKTLGITYTGSGYAFGAQRTKNDGTKVALLQAANIQDQVDTVAASFSANKEITLGASYSVMERTGSQIVTGPDMKVIQAVIAYNLGPVVASIAYEDAKNAPSAGTNTATASGADSQLTKIKVKANF
jgi:predicted porin